ncbi:MarR family transcriptional regulator [Streptomyces anulatus]|uniref:MarR family transcriptional regulator n=1 Tax=Streptomyces anulatus TaxID=1892 RepID=UPI0033CD1024
MDHLPEGAAISVKTLAKQLPLYGQQAISTALTALSVAGHLRRVRCAVGQGETTRWAFRTFWSRTARDNEWWNTHLAAESTRDAAPAPAVTASSTAAPPPPLGPGRGSAASRTAGGGPGRSRPGAAGASSRGHRPGGRGDCGGPGPHLRTAPAHSGRPPGHGTRPGPGPGHYCGAPGRPEALPDGLCRPCRAAHHPGSAGSPVSTAEAPADARDIGAYIAGLRDLLKAP